MVKLIHLERVESRFEFMKMVAIYFRGLLQFVKTAKPRQVGVDFAPNLKFSVILTVLLVFIEKLGS